GVTQFIVSTTGVAFNNSGTVNVQAGTLSLEAGGTDSGDFSGASGATLTLGGNHSLAVDSDITGGLNVQVNSGTSSDSGLIATTGGVTFHGGSMTIAGTVAAGTLNFTGGTGSLNAAATVTSGGTFSSGNLSGSGTVTVAGILNWTDGT